MSGERRAGALLTASGAARAILSERAAADGYFARSPRRTPPAVPSHRKWGIHGQRPTAQLDRPTVAHEGIVSSTMYVWPPQVIVQLNVVSGCVPRATSTPAPSRKMTSVVVDAGGDTSSNEKQVFPPLEKVCSLFSGPTASVTPFEARRSPASAASSSH